MNKLIILPSLFFIGCLLFFFLHFMRSENVEKKTTNTSGRFYGSLEIVIIDSCEYLYGPWGKAAVLTHKGNCKNH
jgi:hypothetical protein